jgi:hypothetical protein
MDATGNAHGVAYGQPDIPLPSECVRDDLCVAGKGGCLRGDGNDSQDAKDHEECNLTPILPRIRRTAPLQRHQKIYY